MSSPEKDRRGWGPKDYWHIGPIYVRKELVLLAVIALSVAVLMMFGLPVQPFRDEESRLPAYRYSDPELAGISGEVQVLDDENRVRYVGEVTAGTYTGRGKVFNEAGELLYDGPLINGVYEGSDAKVYQSNVLVYMGEMAGNLYEGYGRRIDPAAGIVSEGQFSRGLLEGQAQQFYADGTLLRDGVFSRDLLEGEGCEYSPTGVLLREGTFSTGLLHGEGREYTDSGKLLYEGQFWRGIYHGQGTLYDTLLEVRSAAGTFVYGSLNGQGTLYHPSGQTLYIGQVCDERPSAEAFLGLSLAEVEAAFTQHWTLYSCEEITAFVYPYFNLMFITESPVELVSPAQAEEQAQRERQELLGTLERPVLEADVETGAAEEFPVMEGECSGTGNAQEQSAAPSQPPVYEDELLSPDADKHSIIITQVLSYGRPLPGAVQPEWDDASGQHRYGWREWFSDFALGRAVRGAYVRQSGQFVWRFTPRPPSGEDSKLIDEYRVERAGVELMTVRKEDKDMPLWYQTAQWGDGP